MADFAPDRSRYNPQASSLILNAIPTADGWGPFRDIAAFADPLPDVCRGAAAVRNSAGAYLIFAATRTRIYQLNTADGSWIDRSGPSAPYNLPDGDLWTGVLFGPFLVVTQSGNPPQFMDIDTDTAFKDLGGDPPRAKYCWIANGHLVLGGIQGWPLRVQWSGLENIESWTQGINYSDFQDMPNGAAVSGGIGDESGAIVFQRNRVRRMELAPGTDFAFSFTDLDTARGAVAPYSIVSIAGGDFMYLSESGFFRGPTSSPEGAEIVDRWFFKQVDLNFLAEVQGAIDPFNKMVWFRYRDTAAQSRLLGYDWQLRKWTQSDVVTQYLFSLATPGYTLEGLNNVAPLDQLPYSLDSRVWKGGRPTFGAFLPTNVPGFFEGSARAATLDSHEATFTPGGRSFVNGVRVKSDAVNFTVSMGTKAIQSGNPVFGNPATPNPSTGLVPFRSAGRLHKARIEIAAGDLWEECVGIEVDAQPEGD